MIGSSGQSEVTCSALAVDGSSFTCTWHRSN